MMTTQQAVAILATGDELTNGELLNTNGVTIANQLYSAGILTGQQLTIADDEPQLVAGIQYLLAQHQVLITIGGLGPTADDKTRFALSTACDLPLVFNQASWERIAKRLAAVQVPLVDANKPQAFFPKDAEVIPNHNGTADACAFNYQGRRVFMLPGPPKECLPIFEEVILAQLLQANFQQKTCRQRWLLMGVGESTLAEALDKKLTTVEAQLGYRFMYPYIELKLAAATASALQEAISIVMPVIAPYIVSDKQETGKQQLLRALADFSGELVIADFATAGQLQAAIYHPETKDKLTFVQETNAAAKNAVVITGLTDYWQGQRSGNARLTLTVKSQSQTATLRYSGDRLLSYAVEFICLQLARSIA